MVFDEALDDQWRNKGHQVKHEQIIEEVFGFVKLAVHDLLSCLKIVKLAILLFLMHHLSQLKFIKFKLKILQAAFDNLIDVHIIEIFARFFEYELIDGTYFFAEWDFLEVDCFVLDLDNILFLLIIFLTYVSNSFNYLFYLILRISELE